MAISKDYKKYLISKKEAAEMQNNYKEKHLKVLSACQGFPETEYVWFPIKVLRDYLDYVEEKIGNKQGGVTGVQIHFSAYGQGKESIKIPRKYKSRQTVTLLPTVNTLNANKTQSDIYEHTKHEPVFIGKVNKRSKNNTVIPHMSSRNSNIEEIELALANGYPMPPPINNTGGL